MTVLRRLLPQPGEVEAERLFDEVDFGALAPADRPYVAVNMVASADGRATLGGRSGGLGNDADRAVFHALRTAFDAVMVGTGTLRAERYGRLVRDERRRAIRRARGLEPEPLAIVCSRSGDFPRDVPLFTDAEARVLAHTGPSPLEALRRARAEHGVRSVLCEGGPTLNAGLLRAGLVDELFLSVAPKLAGGAEAPTIVAGTALPEPAELELVWMLERHGELFTRWRLASGARQHPGSS